jgi:short-subunit dehydrogenase
LISITMLTSAITCASSAVRTDSKQDALQLSDSATNPRYQGKAAVITGASRGLGAAVAHRLASKGVSVGLLARSETHLAAVRDSIIEQGGQALIYPCDLQDWEKTQAAIAAFAESQHKLDLLVTCAGAKRVGSAIDFTRQDAEETLAVNYLGAVAACQAALRFMGRGGQIIHVSSVLGKRATPTRGAYSASKAALNAYTDALRVELKPRGVWVTLVCPGRLDAEDAAQAGVMEQGVARAADAIVRIVGRRRRELVLTPAGKILTHLNAIAPWLVDRILMRLRRDASDARTVAPDNQTPS